MDSKLIARTIAVALFVVGLWCFAQGAVFSTSHMPNAAGGPTSIWATTATPATNGTPSQNITRVSKWTAGVNTPPGANTHLYLILKSTTSTLLSGMYFGGSQTLASQCGGTLRNWNFASIPITVLTQTTINGTVQVGPITVPSWPGTPLSVAIDTANGQVNPVSLLPTSSNTTPSSPASNFVSYSLPRGASPGEAGNACKSASYTTLANTIFSVAGFTSAP